MTNVAMDRAGLKDKHILWTVTTVMNELGVLGAREQISKVDARRQGDTIVLHIDVETRTDDIPTTL